MFPPVRLLFLTLLCFGRLVLGADSATPEVQRRAAPAWVQPIEVDLAASKPLEQVEDGRYYLLIDRQYHAAAAERYFHFARRALTQTAVQDASRLTLSFDPSYESAALHVLRIHREGQVIDRLAGQEIKLLHREPNLDRAIYDGRLSAVMILDDVRPGDVIEWACSIRGSNPIFGDHRLYSLDLANSEPVHRLHYSLLWPAGSAPGFRYHGTEHAPAVSQRDGLTQYDWDRRDPAPVISDGHTPAWFYPWDWVQISDYRSWAEVVEWGRSLFQAPDALLAEVQQELQTIAAADSKEEQVMAALRYVQDNIRYLGIEVGENSHRPHAVADVFGRRFGDCKDKALLLSTMLRRLGLEAWPALVSTNGGPTVAESLPSPVIFDHAVVQLRLAGLVYWLDATMTDQGGSLRDLYFPSYGRALPIAPDTTEPVEIRPMGLDATAKEEVEHFDFPDFQGGARLTVHTTWKGFQAEEMRSYLRDNSADAIQKSNLNYYAERFGKVETVAPARHVDDRAANVITCDETYLLKEVWKPDDDGTGKLLGAFTSPEIRDHLAKPATRIRTMPFALDVPAKTTHTMELAFPRALNFTAERKQIDDPAFAFSYEAIPIKSLVTVRYTFQSRRDHVPVADLPAYLKNIGKARGLLNYEVNIPKSFAAPTEVISADTIPPAKVVEVGDADSGPFIMALIALGPFALLALYLVHFLRKRRHEALVPQPYDVSSLHRCSVCGRTDLSHPHLEFRVGRDGADYCTQHRSVLP